MFAECVIFRSRVVTHALPFKRYMPPPDVVRVNMIILSRVISVKNKHCAH